jgi:hypothetical protein
VIKLSGKNLRMLAQSPQLTAQANIILYFFFLYGRECWFLVLSGENIMAVFGDRIMKSNT